MTFDVYYWATPGTPQNRDLVSTYDRDIKLTQSALVNHCINRVIRKPAIVYANRRSNAR